MAKNLTTAFFSLLVLFSVAIAWNYWLPAAKECFNQPAASRDFGSYYFAGSQAIRGEDPYVLNGNPYIYPPTFLPLYSAFARLPFPKARTIWTAGLLAFFALTAAAWARSRAPGDRYPVAALTTLIASLSYPLLLHIQQGQIDLLVSGLAVFSFIALRGSRVFLSALLLAAATLLKVNPAILLIYFVLARADLRYLAFYAASLVILAAVSLLAVPFDLYVSYVRDVLPRISNGTSYFYNQSLIRLIPASASGFVPKLVAASGLAGFAAFCVLLRKKRLFPDDNLADEMLFLMNILVMLLFSAIAWYMAYVWVILPASLLLPRFLRQGGRAAFGLAAFAVVLINARPYYFPGPDSLPLIGNILLLGVLSHALLHPPPAKIPQRF